MKIAVTSNHIQNGIRNSCTTCPLALAFKDAGFKNVWIDLNTVQWANSWGYILSTDLPVIASDFIRAFDEGRSVYPFFFDIDNNE